MTFEGASIPPAVRLGALAFAALTAVASLSAAQAPSPVVLVTANSPGENALQIIDPLAAKVVGSVPIPGSSYAHEVAVSDDGRFAFVTNEAAAEPRDADGHVPADFISVIDLTARKEIRRVETGPGSFPHGIVFEGGKVYYTAEGYRLVGRYDPASERLDWMFGTGQVGKHMLAVSKDGNGIFTANTESNTVTALEPEDHQEVEATSRPWTATTIPVGKGPEGIAMSPDGRQVWALARHDGSVSIIDVATKRVTQTFDSKLEAPLRLGFTPDGARVVIADRYSGEVIVVDAVTRQEMARIGDLGSGLHCVLISPDGSRAYVSGGHGEASSGSSTAAVIDLEKLELAGHIVIGEDPDGMAWAEAR
jgi:YVTN family beta-propeller protein